jgi:hypothetical protein
MSKDGAYFETDGEQCKKEEKCQLIFVHPSFDKDIERDTKTMGVYRYRITAPCGEIYGIWDVYEGKGTGLRVDRAN